MGEQGSSKRRHRVAGAVLRRLTVDQYEEAADHDDRYFEDGFADADRYFERFDGHLDLTGKSVIDVGCGYGSLCLRAAELGAARAAVIDVSDRFVDYARSRLEGDYAGFQDRVAIHKVEPSGWAPGQLFDVVLSKDSFEHIANPEGYIHAMKSYLAPGGTLAIGFGPLWRSPYGGHHQWMSKVPWIHLVFSERVVMAEWRRLGLPGEATSYANAAGGLNKMTLRRFLGHHHRSRAGAHLLRGQPDPQQGGQGARGDAPSPGPG